MDINAANKDGWTPLSQAAARGHKSVVSQLLAIPGIDVNAAHKDGWTPLSQAAAGGHEAVVRQLLAVPGIDVNAAHRDGWTPLSEASSNGYKTVVGQLLAVPGIDVNAAHKDGWTPLSQAASRGHEAVVSQLLAAPGIDVNAAHKDGWTPLSEAASNGHEKVVGQLLAAPGIDVNAAHKDGWTPLSQASSKGYKAIVSQLLAASVNVSHKDNKYPPVPKDNMTHFKHHPIVEPKVTLNSPMIDVKIKHIADSYTVGILYIKLVEMQAITMMLDERHDSIPLRLGDDNEYTLGKIGNHNVAIAGPPRGAQGKVAIADVVGRIRLTFKNIRMGLLVGIGGGVPRLPKSDVRLGDVVVGAPEVGPAIVQYDLGKQLQDDIEVTRTLSAPPALLLRVVDIVDNKYQTSERGEDLFIAHLKRFAKYSKIKDRFRHPSVPDRLFLANYHHEDGTQCGSHDQRYEVERQDRDPPGEIRIHYSTILSGDRVMKSGEIRDQLSSKYYNALCFEMEAAGLMDVFPSLVIRGICDYSDSHKNEEWQGYAAATAASYAREILLTMAERVVEDPSNG